MTLMSMRRVVSMLALLALGGCADGTGLVPENPDLEGVIVDVPEPARRNYVIVGEIRTPTSGYETIMLIVGSPARPGADILVRGPNGRLRRGGVDDLRTGSRISAWTTGVELRSLPPQWHANYVIVEPPDDD